MGKDMASTDAPFGIQPYEKIIHASMYAVVTSNSVAMAIGDSVEAVGTAITTAKLGTIQACITEETGAAASIIGGVLALFDHNMLPVNRIAVTTTGDGTVAGYALVADSPDQFYIAAEDGDTSSIQVADIGLNVDLVSTHAAAAANNYLSKMEIDSNTIANTATLAWKVLGVHPDDSISAAGAAGNHARFIIKLNTPYLGINQTSL